MQRDCLSCGTQFTKTSPHQRRCFPCRSALERAKWHQKAALREAEPALKEQFRLAKNERRRRFNARRKAEDPEGHKAAVQIRNRRQRQRRDQSANSPTLDANVFRLQAEVRSAKFRSLKRDGLEWTVKKADLVDLWERSGGRCALSGLPMTLTPGLNRISLDRIDDTVGYVPDNVQLVCKWVSLAKQSDSNEAVLAVIAALRSQ